MKKVLLSSMVLAVGLSLQAQTSCSELFISEYVEGSSHNKALEIYNPTTAAVNLSNYRLVRYSNGSAVGVDSFPLSGTLASHDVWVITNGQATPDNQNAYCDSALIALADQLGPAPYVAGTAVMFMNGDDALALIRIAPYAVLDIFGKIGEDPGTAWTDVFPYTDAQGAWITSNHTLLRKPTITQGVTTNPSAFNVLAEWDSLPNNTWTNLGTHNCNCNTVGIQENQNAAGVSVYPNPSNDVVNVNSSEAISTVEIYNTLGELVFTQSFSSASQTHSTQINLNTMPGGMYMVQVLTSNGQTQVSRITLR
jgi:predicted extracellular nuclease